jgi:hypothetical protein
VLQHPRVEGLGDVGEHRVHLGRERAEDLLVTLGEADVPLQLAKQLVHASGLSGQRIDGRADAPRGRAPAEELSSSRALEVVRHAAILAEMRASVT